VRPSRRISATLSVGIIMLAGFARLPPAHAGETPTLIQENKEQRDQRMKWWREARFGMFVHWGLYAIPAGEWRGKAVGSIGEWIMNNAHIPVAEYEQLASQFNPVKFDARQWARTIKDAGMEYLVITSKHHDGFCLFDSRQGDYNVVKATPFKRDVLEELSAACKEEGVTLCFYHSIMDWHHPDAQAPGFPNYSAAPPNPNFPRYAAYMRGQLKELLANYGHIGILWFDGEWIGDWTEAQGIALYNELRAVQPDLIINNRIGKSRSGMQGMSAQKTSPGDYGTPEQEIPATGIPGADWESCMTMNDTWGFKKNDQHWKSTETLMHNLVDIASKGGNFLLNVGPTAEGEMPAASVERLAAIGKWMKVNGDSIYATGPSPFARLPWGRCTTKPGKLFLHVFKWPKDGKLDVPGLSNKVSNAFLLTAPSSPLKVTESEGRKAISLPAEAPNAIDTVVVLQIEGEPNVTVPAPAPKKAEADGSVQLLGGEAALHGGTIRYEEGGGKDALGFWTDPKDWVSWEFTLDKPGKFEVGISLAAEKGSGGEYALTVRSQELSGEVAETGSWSSFVTEKLGKIELAAAGKYTLAVKPRNKRGIAVMNLRTVVLKPTE